MLTDELLETLFPLGFSGNIYEVDKASISVSSHFSKDLLTILCNFKWNGLSMLLFLFLLGKKTYPNQHATTLVKETSNFSKST